jgi:transposase
MTRDAREPLPDDLATLRAMLLERERELQAMEDRIATRERDLQTLAATAQLQSQTIAEQARRQDQLEHRIGQLLKQLYGRKSERFVDPDQLLLFDEDDLKALEQEQRDRLREDKLAERQAKKPDAKPKRPGHGRRELPDHLPREVVRHEIPPSERACPGCGQERVEIGCESSEQLEFVPASFKVLVHERVKYACRGCQEHVAIAAPAPKPIEKGLPGPGLLAHTTLAKYGDHLPLYRLEDIAARSGIILRRSTLCDWIARAAELAEPLYRHMIGRVLASQVLHTDDTTVKMLDPPRESRTARFWGYLGDARHPYVVYRFTESRKRDGPATFLATFEGYLQADAYGGYDGIYSGGRVREVACWAHARRKWDAARTTDPARSHHVLALIQQLYAIERAAKGSTATEKLAIRQERSLPILTELERWLEAERPHLLPKSPAGQAATYMTNQWAALNRYCESGLLSIDNNAAERAMKPCAIGRKNWLFVGSRTGGERAAVLLSLVQSCKQNQVEPWAYLRDIFDRLPRLGPNPTPEKLEALLPDRWLKSHPDCVWQIDRLRHQGR